MEKRGIRFGNEFFAFYLHAVADVAHEVDYESCAIQTFTPVMDKFLNEKSTYFYA